MIHDIIRVLFLWSFVSWKILTEKGVTGVTRGDEE
jgi:hypothetical protein